MVQLHFLNSLASTKSTKSPYDLPTFYLAEGIKGYVSLGSGTTHGLEAQVRLVGTLSLSAASTMASYGSIDLRYHELDSRKVLEAKQTLPVDNRDVLPFHLEAPNSLVECSSFPATLRTSSASIETDIDLGYSTLPLMVAAVTYIVEVTISRLGQQEHKFAQEIRILNNSVDTFDYLRAKDAMAQTAMMKQRRVSLARISPSRSETDNNITLEMAAPNALSFDSRSDAAASKMSFKVTVRNDPSKNTAPAPMRTSVNWNLQSATDMVMSSLQTDDAEDDNEESSLVLNKSFPVQKKHITCDNWQPNHDDITGQIISWSSTNSFYITESTSSFLTPTFFTPYLSHSYTLHLRVKAEQKQGTFKARKAELTFDMPISVSYDRADLPIYVADSAPPMYANTNTNIHHHQQALMA